MLKQKILRTKDSSTNNRPTKDYSNEDSDESDLDDEDQERIQEILNKKLVVACDSDNKKVDLEEVKRHFYEVVLPETDSECVAGLSRDDSDRLAERRLAWIPPSINTAGLFLPPSPI